MDRIGKMTAFAKVVETGSFAGAAEQLHLSATMVSKHVRELEDWLGVRLLNRTTRSVALTEIGTQFYQKCSQILQDLSDLENVTSQMQARPRGVLRVSAPLAFGAVRIAAVLADFAKLCPDVTVELILTDRMVDVVEEGFDLALVIGDLPDSSYVSRLLCVTHTVLCAAPRYLAQYGTPCTPADLDGHNRLGHTTEPLSREWTFRDREGKIHTTKIDGNFRTNSVTAELTAAIHGQGLTLQPDYLVIDALRDGRLVALLTDYTTLEIPLHVVYPPGRYPSTKVRAFIDFLVGRFSQKTV